MNFLFEIYKNPFKFLFFLILILYVLLYTPYGLEDGDMGSIFGISWSMYNGYFPYRDFVYIKPPFSPFFHSLPLYISEEYAYIFNRGFYFIQVFIYSYLASRLLFKHFGLKKSQMVYLIAIIGAMVSIHNYPPMPWNTIDGVFFSVIGLTFIFKEKTRWWDLLLGALFVSLGVLCKQSFYFFPVFITIYLLWKREFKKVGVFVGFGITFAAIFLLILQLNGALQLFIDQMFSFTSSSSLLSTGVRSYYLSVKFNILFILIFSLIIWASRKFAPRHVSFLITHLIIAGVFIYLYYTYGGYYVKKYGILQILWLGTVIFSLYRAYRDPQYLFLTLLLSLGWCASISNGFNTPIDFSTPIFFGLFLLFFASKQFTFQNLTGALVILVFFGTFMYGYNFIYRDSPKNQLTYPMGEVFPQLSLVKSDQETYEKYKELKALSSEYDNFTVLPSMTLAHYLTATTNPIGVDWVFNHHLSDQLEAYKIRLEDNNVTVFLEIFEGHKDKYEETSLLTMHVKNNWKLIEKRNHFRVYRKP